MYKHIKSLPPPLLPTGNMMTDAQNRRKELGLPYEGTQPAVVFFRTFIDNGSRADTPCPQHDRYYTHDSRCGNLSLSDLVGLCHTHTVNLLKAAPEPYYVKLYTVQAITSDGYPRGGGSPLAMTTLDKEQVERLEKAGANSPQARKLLKAYPGETLERAVIPLPPRSAFANADISSITSQVARGSADATGSRWPLWVMKELDYFCKTRPSP